MNTVFQSYALFPHLNVADNVAFGLKYQRVTKEERRKRVSEALGMVQLGAYGDRKPGQLSGGQQQRVALARALVLRPRVLLLDEPLGALDARLRKDLQVELKTLQVELGVTFVFVTHDQEEALTMSDRVAVMNGGRVEQAGAPQAIYEEPATRLRRRLPGRLEPAERRLQQRATRTASRCRIGERTLHARTGRAGHPRPGQGDDPPRAGRYRAPGRRRRQPPAGHGRALGLPRQLPRAARPARRRRPREVDHAERRLADAPRAGVARDGALPGGRAAGAAADERGRSSAAADLDEA